VAENVRSEARSVILRLRRYRDRIEGLVAAATNGFAAGSTTANVLQRQIKSLQSDLDNDAHECVIDRKRMVQTECEHEFLWPALREAADAICQHPGTAAIGLRPSTTLSSAQGRIQHYLSQLEGRWPTL